MFKINRQVSEGRFREKNIYEHTKVYILQDLEVQVPRFREEV